MQSPFLKLNEIQKNPNINQNNVGVNFISPVSIQKKPIVEIKNLSVVYFPGKSNEVTAVEDISLEIYPEEYVMFFGPSGCGKSTVLNIIAGLEIPSRGLVKVGGQDLAQLHSMDMAKFHRKTTGMIFQVFNLIPTLNVLDNILLPQIFERIKSVKRKEIGRLLLKKLGLETLEKRLPQELSGGQQQRVGIARALINDAPIILADEAVGNLDSVSAENVLEILNNLNLQDKKTIISVTHNPEHLFYADRVFYMKDGKIIKVEVNEKRKKIKGQSEDGGIKKERTELDLLLQAFPDLTSMQLHVMLAPFKAKMLVAYLLSSFEAEEIKTFEQHVTERLLGKTTKEQLFHTLNAPTEEGGMGLNLNTARKFSGIIEEVVEKGDFIQKETPLMKQNKIDPIVETVDTIRKTLLEKFDGELTLDQVAALNKGIEYRIFSKISRREFQEFLDRPFEKGGVGLNARSARNLSRKLELIMLMKFGKGDEKIVKGELK
jgi:putative ABC transport system ATP-binding protein